MKPEERADKAIRDWNFSGDLHPIVADAIREAEAAMKERCIKVAKDKIAFWHALPHALRLTGECMGAAEVAAAIALLE